ncbi:MAG TPA: hypothetical protein VIG30_05745 [Ktedonobacterales bacterium]|jgi:hypothetical protein
MAREMPRDEHWTGRGGRQALTVADLCRAIAERRIPAIRQRDEYVLTARDMRRWLEGRAGHARSAS